MNDPIEIKLSVIVCTYNRENRLKLCLKALEEQTLEQDQFEVIVVNNNSTDATEDILRSFIGKIKHYHYVLESKQGASHARNRGYLEAEGKYIIYIDDDAQADPLLCGKILRAFTELSPTPLSIGAQIKPLYECTPPYWFKEHLQLRTWGDKARYLDSEQARFGFCGACFAIQKSLLFKYNGFSVNLGPKGKIIGGGEETDLFNRIFKGEPAESRKLWYDPSILVLHWCPKEYMTIRYILRRGFGFGLSSGTCRTRKRNILIYLIRWIVPFREFVFGLKSVITARSGERTANFVLLLRKIAWEIGYQIKR